MYVVVVNWQYSAATLFLSVFLSRQASMTTWNVYHNHVILCVWERRKKNMKMKLFQRMMGNSCPWRYLVHFNPQYCCDNLVFNALKGALLEGNPRVEGLKDLEGPKGLIWINTYVLDLVTFQRLLHDTFKKQTSKTQAFWYTWFCEVHNGFLYLASVFLELFCCIHVGQGGSRNHMVCQHVLIILR